MVKEPAPQTDSVAGRDAHRVLSLRELVGSGDRIALFVLPFLAVGLVVAVAFPEQASAAGPPGWLGWISALLLTVGLVTWAWSVALILTRVRSGHLVTSGPYALVKHPLYTSVGLLVLPCLGFLLDTWLGLVVGVALYVASRRYGPEEEAALAERFGPQWEAYVRRVRMPWL
jgi:protein-S-isoprenylcysteine O-methyltransferase Ste14